MSNQQTFNKNTRIGVFGAGPAGLSVAYFLQKRGYTNVTVLEKLGRIGGKCDSFTYKGKSFDLGANYITSSYKIVRKMAREVGAKMYTEGPVKAYDYKENKFVSLLKAVSKESRILTIFWKIIVYVWKRWRLNSIISLKKPGYANISQYPELTVPFSTWLENNKLSALETLFDIPLTNMGYGELNEIPAAYALTYMNLGTFINLAFAALSTKILGWPKRFTEGYGRFWERISWKLNVITGVEIENVDRSTPNVVKVKCKINEQILDKIQQTEQIFEFDYIILATPLTYDVISSYLHDLNEEEEKLFKQIMVNPFVIVTYDSKDLEELTAATFMLPVPPIGLPFVITRQFADNNLVEFYTRVNRDQNPEDSRKEVLKNNQEFIRDLDINGAISEDYYTYDEWPYFPHVSSENMQGTGSKDGFYDKMAAMQGQRNTFYVGGAMAFELVEPIVSFSKHLVKKHFPKV